MYCTKEVFVEGKGIFLGGGRVVISAFLMTVVNCAAILLLVVQKGLELINVHID